MWGCLGETDLWDRRIAHRFTVVLAMGFLRLQAGFTPLNAIPGFKGSLVESWPMVLMAFPRCLGILIPAPPAQKAFLGFPCMSVQGDNA